MKKDSRDLVTHAFIICIIIAGWIGLTSLGSSALVHYVLSLVGFAVIVLYYRIVLRGKLGLYSDESAASYGGGTKLPIRQVFGIGELLWSFKYRARRRDSQNWPAVPGKVESHEFLRFGSNAGWLKVSYQYTFNNEIFRGEMRKPIFSTTALEAEVAPATIDVLRQFPLDSQVAVRVDPKCPSRSVLGLA